MILLHDHHTHHLAWFKINTCSQPKESPFKKKKGETAQVAWKKQQKSMTPWQMLLKGTVSQLAYTLFIMLITHLFSLRDFRHYLWIIKSQLHVKLLCLPSITCTVDSRKLEPLLTRTSRSLKPKSISRRFPTCTYCNFTLSSSNSW